MEHVLSKSVIEEVLDLQDEIVKQKDTTSTKQDRNKSMVVESNSGSSQRVEKFDKNRLPALKIRKDIRRKADMKKMTEIFGNDKNPLLLLNRNLQKKFIEMKMASISLATATNH